MKAGRDLDLLVAEKVMGCKPQTPEKDWFACEGEFTPRHRSAIPEYSTDISAAWAVVEKMNTYFKIERGQQGKGADLHQAAFGNANWCLAHTAPHTICEAALAAVGVKIET